MSGGVHTSGEPHIALPVGHPLTARETLALKELAGEPCILFPRDLEPDTHDRFTAACLTAVFMPDIAQEATGLQTLLGLVATGLGVAFITDDRRGGLGPGIVFRPLHPNPPTLTNAIVWRTGHRNPSIDVFTAIARSG